MTRRVLFCTGKVYYDILNEREQRGLTKDVAISRIEQVHVVTYVVCMENVCFYTVLKLFI